MKINMQLFDNYEKNAEHHPGFMKGLIAAVTKLPFDIFTYWG